MAEGNNGQHTALNFVTVLPGDVLDTQCNLEDNRHMLKYSMVCQGKDKQTILLFIHTYIQFYLFRQARNGQLNTDVGLPSN